MFAGAFPFVSAADAAPLVHVVEDDEAVRDSLCWLLESAGYRVLAYPSAERFLTEADRGAAAVGLVLDVHLPGMSGLDLQQVLTREAAPRPSSSYPGTPRWPSQSKP